MEDREFWVRKTVQQNVKLISGDPGWSDQVEFTVRNEPCGPYKDEGQKYEKVTVPSTSLSPTLNRMIKTLRECIVSELGFKHNTNPVIR